MQNVYEPVNNESYFNLETKLSKMLKPVRPNPEFLNTLKNKLTHTPSILLESSKKNLGLLIFGAGLFAGALAFWIIGQTKKLKK
jgi:hypothetical protein